MARDSSLFVRKAVLAAIKGDAGVTALVKRENIFPETVVSDPDYPIIMFGSGDATPLRRSCVDGMTMPFTMTAYAKARYAKIGFGEVGQMLETAEDAAKKLAAVIAAALDRKKFTLATEYEAVAHTKWQGGICRRSGNESDAWQAVVRFTVRVIS